MNFTAPYQMLSINCLSVVVLFVGIIIFYCKTRRLPNFSILLFLFSFLAILSIFRSGVYESGDMQVHVSWLMSFVESLKQGIWKPEWTPEMCGGNGCPTFQFTYQLPYYIASIFYFIGFSFTNSIKLLLVGSFLLSGFTSFWWFQRFSSKPAAFFAALIYQFSPYHLINLHLRTTIGETLAFALGPLVISMCYSALVKKQWFDVVMSILLVSAMILSHQALSILLFVFLIFFLLTISKNLNYFLSRVSILLLIFSTACMLTMYYWLPALAEEQYIHQSTMHTVSFPILDDFFYSHFGYGFLYQGGYGNLSSMVGYVQLIAVVSGLVFFFTLPKESNQKKLLGILTISFFAFFCFAQQQFGYVWTHLPILNNFQSSHRVLFILTLQSSFIAAICFDVCYRSQLLIWRLFKKRSRIFLLLLLSGLIAIPTILNWQNRRMLTAFTDTYLRAQLYRRGDYNLMPIWLEPYTSFQYNDAEPMISEYPGLTYSVSKSGASRTVLEVNSDSFQVIKLRQTFFPGWLVKINHQVVPVAFTHTANPGVIHLTVPRGRSQIELTYELTPMKYISRAISSVVLAAFCIGILIVSIVENKPSIHHVHS